MATASGEYAVVFSWAELFVSPVGDSVLVVYERDGAPIPDDEGRIALIAVTDRSSSTPREMASVLGSPERIEAT